MSDSRNDVRAAEQKNSPRSVSPSLQAPSNEGVLCYLITGGTGFLGSHLTRSLLRAGHRVRAYARGEHGHEALERSVPAGERARLSTLLGAVEDLDRLRLAMRGVDYVIHAAAQKIVPLAEYDPGSCLRSNVSGTMNVALAALEANVRRAVLISTDKASAPATVYGASKLCGERAWLAANRYSAGARPEYVAVRYGNVWRSRGSVLEAWDTARGRGEIPGITDPRCTRFHFRLEQAAEFVLQALHEAKPGDLWVPRLPTYKLGDLWRAYAKHHDEDGPPRPIGLRLAEKMHESLISENESSACARKDERKYVLRPGEIHEQGGWSYHSGGETWRLGVEDLVREMSG